MVREDPFRAEATEADAYVSRFVAYGTQNATRNDRERALMRVLVNGGKCAASHTT
jgi:hypothetical protein